MCDQNNDNNCETNVEQKIPSFVGQYRRRCDDRTPQVVVAVDVETHLSTKEALKVKKYCNFYKCTANWPTDGTLSVSANPNSKGEKQCLATRQKTKLFEEHLKQKHQIIKKFFCFYCRSSPNRKTYPYNYLIKHMWKRHRFRRFQCNLCLYRAITEDHVIIHQKLSHSSEYAKTIDVNAIQSSNENFCKVLVCPKLEVKDKDEERNLFFYWNKYKTLRLNSEGKNETLYQCLYCPQEMNELKQKVVDHIVERHPDYPILYFIPEPHVSSSSSALVELPSFSTYEKTPTVLTKLEPQDNSISSTQRSPDISEVYDNPTQKRRISSDEEQNIPKRIRADSSGENISQSLTKDSNEPKKNICFFCDKSDGSDAIRIHMKSHFDVENRDNEWIERFIRKQDSKTELIRSERFLKYSKSEKTFYFCPLCVRLGKLRKRYPRYFKTFSVVSNHLWDHCCWLPVKCKVKDCKERMANSDSIIAEHFTKYHFFLRSDKKLKFLFKEETDIKFNDRDRSYLEKEYIKFKSNPFIEEFINKMLVQIKDQFESELRKKNDCPKLPKVCVKKLSNDKFDKYYSELIEYNQRKQKEKEEKEILEEVKLIDEVHAINQKKSKDKRETKKSKPKETYRQKSETNESSDSSLESIRVNRGRASSNSNDGIDRNRLTSVDSRDSDIEEDEASARISCYHCNDKFKTNAEFKEHSKRKHPNQVQRMYKKPHKPNN